MSKVSVKFKRGQLRALRRDFGMADSYLREATEAGFDRIQEKIKETIEGRPWEIGGHSGGAPRDTGNLLRSHIYQSNEEEMRIRARADYAQYVHGGTKYMEPRPWLNYAMKSNLDNIEREGGEILERLISKLT